MLRERKKIGLLLLLRLTALQSHGYGGNALERRNYCQNHSTHELDVIGKGSRCILALRRRFGTSHDTPIYRPYRMTILRISILEMACCQQLRIIHADSAAHV